MARQPNAASSPSRVFIRFSPGRKLAHYLITTDDFLLRVPGIGNDAPAVLGLSEEIRDAADRHHAAVLLVARVVAAGERGVGVEDADVFSGEHRLPPAVLHQLL